MTEFGPGVIETYSGTAYEFMNPDPNIITIEDVAHALSNTCRFSGHVQKYYSVAEHSILVSRILEKQGHNPYLQLCGLLHDAEEAYTQDIPKPLKLILEGQYAMLSGKSAAACAKAFGVSVAKFHCEPVKAADNIALKVEGHILMRSGAERWMEPPLADVGDLPDGALNWPIGMDPIAAKQQFLRRAERFGLITAEVVPYA